MTNLNFTQVSILLANAVASNMNQEYIKRLEAMLSRMM